MSKKKNTQRKRQAAEQRKPFAFKESYDVVIIGGGASGLACAVSCLREARAAGAALPNTLLVEQGKRIGAPILRSGNGRCNFSNSQLDVSRYWNSAFVSQTLGFLGGGPVRPITNWLEELGLIWEEAPESDGLLYPFSNKASSVLEVLMAALPAHVVDIHPCVKALETHRSHDGFDVFSKSRIQPRATEVRLPANPTGCRSRQQFAQGEWLLLPVVAAWSLYWPVLFLRCLLHRGVQRSALLLRHSLKTYRVKNWMVYAPTYALAFRTAAFPKRAKYCFAAMAYRASWCSTLHAMRIQAKRCWLIFCRL